MKAAQHLSFIQALRAIAACAVVCHHALRAVTVNRPAGILKGTGGPVDAHPVLIEIGAMGVDLFFVLSGFLMIYISRPYVSGQRTVGHFLGQRLIRVWPLYALITAYMLQTAQDGGAQAIANLHSYDASPMRLGSFLFLPSFNANGLLQPILGVGWTLNYEFYFYLCVALAIVLPRPRPPLIAKLGALLAMGFVVGRLCPAGSVASAFLGNSVVFEFMFGALIASRLISGKPFPLHPAIWMVLGVAWLLVFARFPADDGLRVVTRGVPAAFFFVALMQFNARLRFPGWLTALGDASYSLYLIHILVIYRVTTPAFYQLAAHLPPASLQLAVAALAVAASIGAGLLCFHLIERPLLHACRRVIDYRAPRTVS